MSKYVFNNSGSTKTWIGQDVTDQTYFQIPAANLAAWADDTVVQSDVLSGAAIMSTTAASSGHISDPSTGLNFLKDLNIPEVHVNGQPPFADKVTSTGLKLYRRVHGVKKTLSGDTTFDIVVPYSQCKINAIEILWAPAGLQADLKVYDTPTGTISTVPNYMLNQFGFDAGIAANYYEEASNYDADLIADMKVEVTLKNPNNATDEVCVNFILHEMKP